MVTANFSHNVTEFPFLPFSIPELSESSPFCVLAPIQMALESS